MEDLNNEAQTGSEDVVVSEKPVSIRDSLVAAMKEAPADTTEQKPDSRSRDEAGRFAAKQVEQKTTAAATQQPVQQQAAPQASQPEATAATQPVAQPVAQPIHKAPPGWSADAKAAFDTLPENVKVAISNREQEVDKGFKVLQDYKGLEEFTPLIKQGNTTHAEVMRKALDYEKFLQRDPIGTVFHVAQIGGVNIRALAQAIVEGKINLPAQQPAPQPQRQQPQPQPINVEATVEEVLRKRDTQNQVDAFLSDKANTHAEAVLDDMVALISAGRAGSLKDAYDMACWMRPDIRQQLINQTAAPVQDEQARRAAAADQARRASKSITGSSAPGPSANAGAGKPSSIRDTLKEAMAAQGGRV
ncbi:hypothetical protein [Rhizobium sp. NXC24]|uniref:hypothetical protein n=1 Tax=Rhizobium sp. NXC24 TaxID=2048897 RepID=UPI000CDF4EC4|nr:hypothetical protein [Rhizobium sp. NXC24]AVA22475.1 hypothetical protein NXC24_CH02845 [Rhizobium sp. NXC24]